MQQPHSALRRCLGKGRPVSHGNKEGAPDCRLSPRPKTNPKSALGGTGGGRRESKGKRRRRPGCAAATAQDHIRSPALSGKILGMQGAGRGWLFQDSLATRHYARTSPPNEPQHLGYGLGYREPEEFCHVVRAAASYRGRTCARRLSMRTRRPSQEPPRDPSGLPKSRLGILQASPRKLSEFSEIGYCALLVLPVE